MVLGLIKRFLQSQRMKLAEIRKGKNRLESFKETEEMKKAEEMKKEADRLTQLKEYKTAIVEYNKALEFYPYKGNEQDLFRHAAEFVFKSYYNIAACFSYLDKFDEAIAHFDKALAVSAVDEENKVRALMGKGSCLYRKKLIAEGRYKPGSYKGMLDYENEISDDKIAQYAREDKKLNYLKLAHDCFSSAAELSKNHVEAWYNKGHMEFLMDMKKDAVQSFDNVININKNFENKESIPLFDEIKKERGVPIKASEIMEREYAEPVFRTKTGHLVKAPAEVEIANFLFDNNLLFQYNMVANWADKNDFRSAFYIPKLDLYIDHHPYDYLKEYQKIMRVKIKQYEKHRKKHIYITSEDEKNIEESIKLKMKPYVIL